MLDDKTRMILSTLMILFILLNSLIRDLKILRAVMIFLKMI